MKLQRTLLALFGALALTCGCQTVSANAEDDDLITQPQASHESEAGDAEQSVDSPPPTCSFERVYFDFDESRIRSDMESVIEENAACYAAYQAHYGCDPILTIVGHTDSKKTEEYSLSLGERYAKSVKKALKKEGVPADALQTDSQGEYEPVVKNAKTEADHQKNRRAEFELEACALESPE